MSDMALGQEEELLEKLQAIRQQENAWKQQEDSEPDAPTRAEKDNSESSDTSD